MFFFCAEEQIKLAKNKIHLTCSLEKVRGGKKFDNSFNFKILDIV